ncbi:hypothetical protein [Streptomyces sp. V1I6]|uniref:hypothetical protein n=1 Tax=Streptomyces sp. V1I6 TaxID=3042273 RepID=UPI002789EBF8|nr:hypothetical protein [Streptomyces sp. V1I6]MDQ0842794.1 hypothetical protein [Streptomyces sp. V1I6]
MTGRGRSTARAALIHQHAMAERERLIGQAVSAVVEQAQNKIPIRTGTQRARRRKRRSETHQGQAGG